MALAEDEKAGANAISNARWYYLDPYKMIRGPFSTTEMYTWYRDGYFTDELEIACGDAVANAGLFAPLKEFKAGIVQCKNQLVQAQPELIVEEE
jgi:hypothetical protein